MSDEDLGRKKGKRPMTGSSCPRSLLPVAGEGGGGGTREETGWVGDSRSPLNFEFSHLNPQGPGFSQLTLMGVREQTF